MHYAVLAASLAVAVVLLAVDAPAAGAGYPGPSPLADESGLGEGIQRTMTLLATSTPVKRNRVRVLFYGQSITVQAWWEAAADDLRRRFPHAELEIENRALGGFASQLLVRTAEYDVFPFYPDLVIFHVYGSHIAYDEIIRGIRSRTTAEVLMQSDHVTEWPKPLVGTNQWKWPWTENMNRRLLPEIARKYGCPFVNIRGWWLDYLKEKNLQPKDLLRDNVHLNGHGEFLMARLVSRYLRHNPALKDDSWRGMVRDFQIGEVGKGARWDRGRLSLEFDGNRVDVVASNGAGRKADVLIDGRKPSDFPELYYHARPGGTPHIGWPAIKRISFEKPLLIEEWTATVRGMNDAQDRFTFSVEGSRTGPDGSGSADAKFVSKSGRVVIEPDDWVFAYDRKVSGKRAPDGFKVRWKVKPLFTDTYEPPEAVDPSREHATTLARGLANGPHTLELVARGPRPPALGAIRVYRPPVRPAGDGRR